MDSETIDPRFYKHAGRLFIATVERDGFVRIQRSGVPFCVGRWDLIRGLRLFMPNFPEEVRTGLEALLGADNTFQRPLSFS